jgi:putative ABC transport system permease protein
VSLWTELRTRLSSLLFGARADRESQEEFRFHLDMETQKLMAQGLPKKTARRQAALAFGGIQAIREEARDARGVRWIEDSLRDLQLALRQLRLTPGFTFAVVVTLAIGIGATTAIFTVFDGLLLRPAPFPDADRLVVLWETDRASGTTREPASWPDLLDFRQRAETVTEVAAVAGAERNFLPRDGDPVRLSAMGTTPNYFDLVGITPLLGRSFQEAEGVPGGPRVVLLGERFWRGALGGEPDIVGTTLLLDESPHTIVGVLPAGADFGLDPLHARAAYHNPYTGEGEVDVWVPLQASEEQFPRSTHPFLTLARLTDRASAADAQDELATIAAALEAEYPDHNANRGVFVEPLLEMVFAPIRPVLWLLLAAVGLLLLVACANVANLLLAQGTTRVREVAVRAALGASTGRLGRQFLAETAVLTALGAGLGIALAYLGLETLLALAPGDLPRIQEVHIDGRVLALAVGLAGLVALLSGIAPTLQALRVNVHDTIKGQGRSLSDGRGRRRLRKALVVAELTLTVLLMVGAGLLLRSFWSVLSIDPGFQAEGILKAEYQLPQSRYPRNYRQYPAFTEIHGFTTEVLAAVEALPGVESVAIAGSHPLDAGFTNSFVVVGRETEAANWPEISVRAVTPGYFETLGVQIVEGRGLDRTDQTDSPPVLVINQAAAALFFPHQTPIGQEIRFWGANRRIVGVVADVHFQGLTEPAPIAAYQPLSQGPRGSGALLVRTAGNPIDLAPAVRRAVREIDPSLALFGVEPLSETLGNSLGERRFALLVLLTFAGVTLLLALVGVHGVLSYSMSLRTQEIGIRTAFGAAPGQVASLVLGEGLRLAMLGIVLGLLAAALGSRLLQGLLYGVPSLDPWTFAVTAGTLLGAALLATWLPARKATRIDPIRALHAE